MELDLRFRHIYLIYHEKGLSAHIHAASYRLIELLSVRIVTLPQKRDAPFTPRTALGRTRVDWQTQSVLLIAVVPADAKGRWQVQPGGVRDAAELDVYAISN